MDRFRAYPLWGVLLSNFSFYSKSRIFLFVFWIRKEVYIMTRILSGDYFTLNSRFFSLWSEIYKSLFFSLNSQDEVKALMLHESCHGSFITTCVYTSHGNQFQLQVATCFNHGQDLHYWLKWQNYYQISSWKAGINL